MKAILICAWLCAAAGLLAQHAITQADVETGGRLYLSNCVVCHGPDGDQVAGVDLGHGKFRRAVSDDDIVHIILNGIPGTGMPSHDFTEGQARSLVAYLRSLGSAGQYTAGAGDAARGKAIVEGKGQCLSCHRVNGAGSRLGPDLSDVGALRRAAELEQSLTDPSAEILPGNRYFHVVTKTGESFTGRLLNEDTFSMQFLDPQEHLRSFQKSDLREYTFVAKSPMPSYKDKLATPELADVVSYLISLKGVDRP